MSIEYHLVAKLPQHLLDLVLSFILILKRSATQNMEQILDLSSKRHGLLLADGHAAVIALSHEIRQSLESGMSLQLDQLGSFSLAARAKGSAYPRQVRGFISKS